MKRIYLLIVMLLTATQFAFAAVNLNTATQAELETVKGIGPVKAKMIIDDRAKNGPFKSLEDLDRVKGFGMKSVDKLRGEVSVTGATRIAPAAAQSTAKPATQPAPAVKTAPVKASPAPAAAMPTAATPVTAPAPADKALTKKEAKAAAKAAKQADKPVPATVH